MKRRLWRLLALISLLPGCVRLSQPAPRTREYQLAYPPPQISGKPLPLTLRVSRFGVAAMYDRQPMVYREDTYSTGTYPYDRWSTNPGNMVADLLARDLNASGLYRAVQQGPSVLPNDLELTGEIEEIEERKTDGSCSAQLRERLLLLRTQPRARDPVLLRTTYAEAEPCRCDDPPALAQAMSEAQRRISTRLQNEMYQAVAGALATSSHSRAAEQPPDTSPTEHNDEER